MSDTGTSRVARRSSSTSTSAMSPRLRPSTSASRRLISNPASGRLTGGVRAIERAAQRGAGRLAGQRDPTPDMAIADARRTRCDRAPPAAHLAAAPQPTTERAGRLSMKLIVACWRSLRKKVTSIMASTESNANSDTTSSDTDSDKPRAVSRARVGQRTILRSDIIVICDKPE